MELRRPPHKLLGNGCAVAGAQCVDITLACQLDQFSRQKLGPIRMGCWTKDCDRNGALDYYERTVDEASEEDPRT
jgi:hypothetical protein